MDIDAEGDLETIQERVREDIESGDCYDPEADPNPCAIIVTDDDEDGADPTETDPTPTARGGHEIATDGGQTRDEDEWNDPTLDDDSESLPGSSWLALGACILAVVGSGMLLYGIVMTLLAEYGVLMTGLTLLFVSVVSLIAIGSHIDN